MCIFVIYINLCITLCAYYFFRFFATDGEFNYLRTMGNKRPISIIQLIKSAKNQARSIHVKTIFSYFQLDEKVNCLSLNAYVSFNFVSFALFQYFILNRTSNL